MRTVSASGCLGCYTLKSGHYFHEPRVFGSHCSLFQYCVRRVFSCVRHRRCGGVAGSLDSKVTRHQLVSETAALASQLWTNTLLNTRPKQQQKYSLERLRFQQARSPHSTFGELKHALTQAGGPTQSQLSRPMSSGHHISMEHRLRRKHLNSDTNVSNKTYLKELQEKRKEETFFGGKRKEKKRKRGPKGWYPPRHPKLIFLRTGNRNRNEIEAQKIQI